MVEFDPFPGAVALFTVPSSLYDTFACTLESDPDCDDVWFPTPS